MVAVTHYGVEGEVVENRIVDVDEINVSHGDNIVFLMTSKQVSSLRKTGDNIKVQFTDDNTITINNFFLKGRADVDTVLTFKDTLYTATELQACFTSKGALVIHPEDVQVIHQHESEHLLRLDGSIDGGGRTSAYSGTTFLYHFTLEDAFPENHIVEVLFNKKPMPDWMTLDRIGPRKYVINGVPEKPSVGENNVQIRVKIPEDGEVIASDYNPELPEREENVMLDEDVVHDDFEDDI